MDVAKAWQFFNERKELDYGLSNIIFSWLDTPDGNYPPLLDSEYYLSLVLLLCRLFTERPNEETVESQRIVQGDEREQNKLYYVSRQISY